MNIPDFKIPGTKLPILPKGAPYCCTRREDTNKNKETWNNGADEPDYVSFGFIMLNEVFILCEGRTYNGDVYYAFKESDIIKYYKEQNQEPAFPERWCIKLTEENRAEVGGYYNKQVVGDVTSNSYDRLPVEESYLRSHDGEKSGKCITDGNCLPYLRFGAPTKDFPEITIEQFREHILKQDKIVDCKENESFKLPEKWYIIRSKENAEILNAWENETFFKSHKHASKDEAMYFFSDKAYTQQSGGTVGYTHITTEQFIKYVLKKEKGPIVSYKLKEQYAKSCYDAVCKICGGDFFKTNNFIMCRYTESIKKLKDAGVLDIWFEPAYSIDYKINDWVTILGTGTTINNCDRGFFSGAKVGDTVKIERISHEGGHASIGDPRYCGSNWNLRREDFRSATEDEIKAVLEPVLYFGKVEFKLDKINMLYTTKYGPVSLDDLQKAIKYILNPPSLGGHSLKIHNNSGYASLGDIHAVDKNLKIGFGCESGTLEELLKLETRIQDYINEKHCK